MFERKKEKTVKVKIFAEDAGMIDFFMKKINTTDTAAGFREMLRVIHAQNIEAIQFAAENATMKKVLDDQEKTAARPADYIQ